MKKINKTNILLWILQIFLGIYFINIGLMHFILPTNLPDFINWMYDLPDTLHYFIGTLEIMAGLGLILPWLTKIQTRLTPIAGLGLVVLMIGAMIWHLQRGEPRNIIVW